MTRSDRDLPCSVEINGREYAIRDKCDYRVVLDCIEALQDPDLSNDDKWRCALYMFYEDIGSIKDGDIEEAMKRMKCIIDGGESDDAKAQPAGNTQPIMDWRHDFKIIAAAVNRILGYDIRTPGKYTHWYSLLAAYMEIGECTFSTVVSIRNKRNKGKKLEKWESEYLRDHRDLVELPLKMTAEERELLNSPW